MKETGLKLKKYPDKVLTSGVKPVGKVTDEHRRLLSEMARLMYETGGVGLAAPQVGIGQALIVIDTGSSGLYKLINPRIIKQEETQSIEEGCLSVTSTVVKVKRAKKITVEALDEYGKPVVIEAKDLLACVFQHEIDHLNGTLIIDHSPDKEKFKKKLNG